VQPCDEDDDDDDDYFCPFPCNGAPVEWNWQGKTEVLGEKPVPVPLCPPQIPHGLTRDRTRASAVGGRRLTAWATARPNWGVAIDSTNVTERGRPETQIRFTGHFVAYKRSSKYCVLVNNFRDCCIIKI
jgi:hypothetical protein